MSLLLDLVSSNTDVALSIFQHVGGIYQLDDTALVCKAFNRVLNDTEQGRQIWLNLGVQVTSGVDHFDAQDIRRRFAQLTTRRDFFWHLRVLVCPWHTEGIRLPVEVWDGTSFDTVLFFADAEETTFQLQNESLDRVVQLSARPGDGFTVEEENVEWLDPVPITHNHDALETMVIQKKVVPDFSHDRGCTYRFFPIHAGAFAVVEVFSRTFDNDEYVDHGIYYFSHITRRVLRHIKYEDFSLASQITVLSRPMELWIQDSYNIEYHGPSCACRSDSTVVLESMDEALWMAGRGDGSGGIKFMQQMGVFVHLGRNILKKIQQNSKNRQQNSKNRQQNSKTFSITLDSSIQSHPFHCTFPIPIQWIHSGSRSPPQKIIFLSRASEILGDAPLRAQQINDQQNSKNMTTKF